MQTKFVHKFVALTASMALLGLTATAFAGKEVPIKGEFATQFQVTGVEFPLPGVPAPVIHLIIQGAGIASHLGLSDSASFDEVVDFTTPGDASLTGTLTLTAANGDKLVGQMNATARVIDNVVHFEGTLTFTGGTGRFAGATGIATLKGGAEPADAPSGPGWFTIEGKVSSPGAAKK
jgi:hypothetical protein